MHAAQAKNSFRSERSEPSEKLSLELPENDQEALFHEQYDDTPINTKGVTSDDDTTPNFKAIPDLSVEPVQDVIKKSLGPTKSSMSSTDKSSASRKNSNKLAERRTRFSTD